MISGSIIVMLTSFFSPYGHQLGNFNFRAWLGNLETTMFENVHPSLHAKVNYFNQKVLNILGGPYLSLSNVSEEFLKFQAYFVLLTSCRYSRYVKKPGILKKMKAEITKNSIVLSTYRLCLKSRK